MHAGQKRSLTWSLCNQTTTPTKIKPTTKLAFEEKNFSDQSHTARHKKTVANNPIRYAHFSFFILLPAFFGLVSSTTSADLYEMILFQECATILRGSLLLLFIQSTTV